MLNIFKQILSLSFVSIAEIHFNLPGFRGFLYRKRPEILFDVPHRIEKATYLPLFLLVKDADIFPATVESFEIIDEDGQSLYLHEVNMKCSEKWHWGKFKIPWLWKEQREIRFWIQFIINLQGHRKEFINDTLPHRNKLPFHVITGVPRPRIEGFFWGDLHMHSSFTEDQIEFGAPLDYLQESGKELGLDFLCITDHSYDLDQEFVRFRKQIPDSEKFSSFLTSVKSNRKKPILIPGIEVSAGNSKGYNIHTLVLNPSHMLEGYGDSGRQWLSHHPTITVTDLLKNELKKDEIAIAAHPRQPIKRSHRVLLKRDQWHEEDLLHDKITGYQILNGSAGQEFIEGKTIWIKHLLEGKRKYIYAGSDAHGNLNLYRQIDIPFFKLRYDYSHQPGKWVTGVYSQSSIPTRKSILKGIKEGSCIVSNGPFLWFRAENEEQQVYPGQTYLISAGTNMAISMTAESTPEFGAITHIILIGGDCIKKLEETIHIFSFREETYAFHDTINIKPLIENHSFCYIRAELASKKNGIALTNPLWIAQ